MADKIPHTGQEALYLVDKTMFLHLQKTEGGVDYTIHDRDTKIHLSGGHISDETIAKAPYRSYLKSARMEVFREQGIKPMQTERINPAIAGVFYKEQILKPSWELGGAKESLMQEPNQPNPDRFENHTQEARKEFSTRPLDVLLGMETKKDEMPKQKESVLNQLKDPVKPAIKVKPHRKTKETPSL